MLIPRVSGGVRVRLLGGTPRSRTRVCGVHGAADARGPGSAVSPGGGRDAGVRAARGQPAGVGAAAATLLALGTDDGVWQVPLDGTGPHRLASIGRVTEIAWGPGRAGSPRSRAGSLYTVDPSVPAAVPLAGSADVRLVDVGPSRRPAGVRAERHRRGRAHRVGTVAAPAARPLRVALPDGLAARALGWLPDGRDLLIAAGPRGGALSSRLLRIRAVRPTPIIGTVETDAVMAGAAIDRTGTLVAYVSGAPDALASGRGVVTVVPPRRDRAAGADAARDLHRVGVGAVRRRRWRLARCVAPDEVAIEVVNAATGARLRVMDYRPELPQRGTALAIRWAPDGMRLAFGTDTGDTAGPVWVATLARQ